jgi:hypothetical protein
MWRCRWYDQAGRCYHCQYTHTVYVCPPLFSGQGCPRVMAVRVCVFSVSVRWTRCLLVAGRCCLLSVEKPQSIADSSIQPCLTRIVVDRVTWKYTAIDVWQCLDNGTMVILRVIDHDTTEDDGFRKRTISWRREKMLPRTFDSSMSCYNENKLHISALDTYTRVVKAGIVLQLMVSTHNRIRQFWEGNRRWIKPSLF